MSDDLIKRLGKSVWTLDQAEDRIKELEESNKELTLQLLATSGQAADALDKLAKAVEALREISAEASVPVHTWKNGINFKKMYEGWRKIAVKKIDVARTTLAKLEGK